VEEKPDELKVNFGVLFFIFLVLAAGFAALVGFDSKSSSVSPTPTPQAELKINLGQKEANNQNPKAETMSQTEEVKELKVEDLRPGTGDEAQSGKKITVNYLGTLVDGTKFDSSYDRGQPFSFVLGSGQVIAGWDRGLVGMKVGGKRKLVIPPNLGYGNQAVGNIPPNSTLIFEVELLSVE